MQAWQAWQAYVRVVIDDPTYSDIAAQASFDPMAQLQKDAYQAIADAANLQAGNDFGISDQAVLNIGLGTESGHGTADVTFTVVSDEITEIYIDNLVVDPESKVDLIT